MRMYNASVYIDPERYWLKMNDKFTYRILQGRTTARNLVKVGCHPSSVLQNITIIWLSLLYIVCIIAIIFVQLSNESDCGIKNYHTSSGSKSVVISDTARLMSSIVVHCRPIGSKIFCYFWVFKILCLHTLSMKNEVSIPAQFKPTLCSTLSSL